MIATEMRKYNFYTFGTLDEYAQPQLSEEPKGTVKMAVYLSSQSIQDNINYQNCNYVGLTNDTKVDDTYVIEYGKEKLKVLYVNPGRYRQVFMVRL